MTACKDCKHLIKIGPHGIKPVRYTILECRVSPNSPEFDPYSGKLTPPREAYKSVYGVNFGDCKLFERG